MIGKSIRKIKLFNRIIKIEFLHEKSMFYWWVCTNEYFLTYLLLIDHQSNISEHISNYTRILPMKYPCIHNKFRKINTNVLRETLDISRGCLSQSCLKNSLDGNSSYSDEFLYIRRWYRLLIVSRCTPLIVSSIHRA